MTAITLRSHAKHSAFPNFLPKPVPARRGDRSGRWSDLVEKHDDRLIRDIGMTREEILGPEAEFWSQWLKQKQPWML